MGGLVTSTLKAIHQQTLFSFSLQLTSLHVTHLIIPLRTSKHSNIRLIHSPGTRSLSIQRLQPRVHSRPPISSASCAQTYMSLSPVQHPAGFCNIPQRLLMPSYVYYTSSPTVEPGRRIIVFSKSRDSAPFTCSSFVLG